MHVQYNNHDEVLSMQNVLKNIYTSLVLYTMYSLSVFKHYIVYVQHLHNYTMYSPVVIKDYIVYIQQLYIYNALSGCN